MMRGLTFREEKVSEKARRGFAKIAAGLALVSALGCGTTSPYTYSARSQYSMSTRPTRQMQHHMTTAPDITVRGLQAKAVDLMLPLERMVESSRTEKQEERRTYSGESARIAGVQGEISGQNRMHMRFITAERYENSAGRIGTFRAPVGFGFDQFLSDDGQTYYAAMIVHNDIGAGYERGFRAERFVRLVRGEPGLIEGVLITQGSFGTYSVFFVPTGADGRPIGRVPEGQPAFGITYDHQRQESVGGLVFLRDP